MAVQQQPYDQGYGQPTGYGQSGTVVITQPVTTITTRMAEFPVNMTCPACQKNIITGTRKEIGTMTWLACLGLCLVGCNIGCCFIPFCVDSCKDTVHDCPSCQTVVGKHNKM
ncbi:LITAF domain-containing protein-like [Mytilus edulis]|uniref:LITAF domain-containing protein-like n=1 Tax=Mytilus edulis TaxID=6550 RepID=UPI0039F14159